MDAAGSCPNPGAGACCPGLRKPLLAGMHSRLSVVRSSSTLPPHHGRYRQGHPFHQMERRSEPAPGSFPETRWTRVLAARQTSACTTDAQEALAGLCESYWKPIRAHALRLGLSLEDAEDATQGFFAEILARDLFSKADPDRGRFRCFLLGAFKRHLAERRRYANRMKRGGQEAGIDLDSIADSEHPGLLGPAPELDAHFDRDWAGILVQRALDAVETDYRNRGQEAVFKRLQSQLAAPDRPMASEKDLPPVAGSERVALLRLRRRFREMLLQEVRDTVDDPADVMDETRHLLRSHATHNMAGI